MPNWPRRRGFQGSRKTRISHSGSSAFQAKKRFAVRPGKSVQASPMWGKQFFTSSSILWIFNYYELYEETLKPGPDIANCLMGLFPQKLTTIINEMIEGGAFAKVQNPLSWLSPNPAIYPWKKQTYAHLKASEKDVIDHVIEQYSDWSARAISDYSHQDMPWLASKEGEEIDYELAFYREVPYSVRNYDEEREEA